MRVAFYSPLPPERSGIADYSYELLEELRHHVDLVAVVGDRQLQAARTPDGIELVGLSSAGDLVVDCNLYQMGNNSKYHRFLFGRAFEEPGLLLLHDPSLADFTAEMCGGAEGAIFRDEVQYDRPDIAPKDDLPLVDVGNGRMDLDRLEVLLARRIVESNIRTLVHSSAMEHEMRHRYAGADIRTIQLPAPVLAERPRDDERRDGEIVFGVFGGINYYKRVRPLVDAFLEVRDRYPLARMVVAGRPDDHLLERELRVLAARPEVAGSLAIHTDLTLAALEAEMLGCDVGITLRWPTAGEMSATLMRTFGAGRPAIVSDVLQFRELDERYCWRVTTDFDLEHERLVGLMSRAASDREMCRRAGDAAREFVARDATYAAVAAQYVEHLEHCSARNGTTVGIHGLRSSRPLGVTIIQPGGSGEVAEAARRTAVALRSSGVDVVVIELACEIASSDGGNRLASQVAEPDRDESQRRGLPVGVGTDAEGHRVPADLDETDLEQEMRAVRALDPLDRTIASAGPHAVDLYFADPLTADRMGRLARVRRGRGRKIVPVLSPEHVPLSRGHAVLLELAEHVWAPSVFAAEVASLHTVTSVDVVPWPVSSRGERTIDAPAFERCSFLAVVEQDATVARANPLAAVAAFRQAFSRYERGTTAEIVVVLRDSSSRLEARELLAAEVAEVAGQLVVDPSDEELRELVAGSDVYVSLHRAQAMGLRLADAMALGKAVLATGYSGNLDFMDDANACLVGYKVLEIGEGDLYLDTRAETAVVRAEFWVEPDLEGAARWMRRLADDPQLRALLGAAARLRVTEQLAISRVGSAARDLLDRIDRERPKPRGTAKRRLQAHSVASRAQSRAR